MIGVFVEPARTPLNFEEAARALRAALPEALLTDEVLALALAKTALETGRWQSMWNSNFGNQKAGSSWDGMWTAIALNEVIDGKAIWFAPEGQLDRKGGVVVGKHYDGPPVDDWHPQCRMRAYANEFDGAHSYVEFLADSRRYAKAWIALLKGDPAEYVHELKQAGYFTADEAQYKRGVIGLYSEFLARLRGIPTTEYQDDWDEIRARVAATQFDLRNPPSFDPEPEGAA